MTLWKSSEKIFEFSSNLSLWLGHFDWRRGKLAILSEPMKMSLLNSVKWMTHIRHKSPERLSFIKIRLPGIELSIGMYIGIYVTYKFSSEKKSFKVYQRSTEQTALSWTGHGPQKNEKTWTIHTGIRTRTKFETSWSFSTVLSGGKTST